MQDRNENNPMKDMLKKINKPLLICLVLFIFSVVCELIPMGEDMIPVRDVRIEVVLTENGDARITEKWDITLKNGQEMYLTRNRLGITEITDLQVTDNGQAMTVISDWRNENHENFPCCGIKRLGEEDDSDHNYELCWHIDGYGHHRYTVSYTMHNFITQYEDGTGFYHTFFRAENFLPAHAQLSISTDGAAIDKTYAAAYGFSGNAWVHKNEFKAKTLGAMRSDDTITVAMTFPEGAFQPPVKTETSEYMNTRSKLFGQADSRFEDRAGGIFHRYFTILCMFAAGALLICMNVVVFLRERRISENDYEQRTFEQAAECFNRHFGLRRWFTPLHLFIYAFCGLFIAGYRFYHPNLRILPYTFLGMCLLLAFTVFSLVRLNENLRPVNKGRAVSIKKTVESTEEVSYEDGLAAIGELSLEEAYIMLGMMYPQKVKSTSLIPAYTLKWSVRGCIEPVSQSSIGFGSYQFVSNSGYAAKMSSCEARLYGFFRNAGGVIDKKVMEKHFRRRYKDYREWRREVAVETSDILQKRGLLDYYYRETACWFTYPEPALPEKGVQTVRKLKGFANLTQDAAAMEKLMSDRSSEEISDELLHIMACAAILSPSDICGWLEDMEADIERSHKQIWTAAFIGAQFGIYAADISSSAAAAASSSGGGDFGGGGGGGGGGGASGGGGGGIR